MVEEVAAGAAAAAAGLAFGYFKMKCKLAFIMSVVCTIALFIKHSYYYINFEVITVKYIYCMKHIICMSHSTITPQFAVSGVPRSITFLKFDQFQCIFLFS